MLFFGNYKKIHVAILLSILLHLIFINFNPVNFEYVFYEGGDFIREKFNKEIPIEFFNQQANTFFFTILVSFFSLIFPFIDNIIIGKLISLSSYLFIGLAVINFYSLKNNDDKNDFIFFVFLFLIINPLIWVFGYRSTPDLISMALSLFGFSLFLKKIDNNDTNFIIPALIMGIATTIKPIVGIYFLLSICFLKVEFKLSFLKKLIITGITYSIVPATYFLLIYFNFGFFLFTNYYMDVLSVVNNYSKYFSNIILYTSFLLIFLIPIVSGRFLDLLINIKLRYKFLISFLGIIVFFISNNYLSLSVEMSFGILDTLLNKLPLKGILGVISFLFFLIIFFEVKKNLKLNNYNQIKLIFIGLLYLIIVASSLASQRYLIVILPVFYFVFGDYYKSKINLLAIFLICVPLNIILVGNQYLTGNLSNRIAKIIYEQGLIEEVCVGAVGSHVSHYFSFENRKAKNCVLKDLHVVNGENSNALLTVKDNFLFINKSYSLIKVR